MKAKEGCYYIRNDKTAFWIAGYSSCNQGEVSIDEYILHLMELRSKFYELLGFIPSESPRYLVDCIQKSNRFKHNDLIYLKGIEECPDGFTELNSDHMWHFIW